MLRLLVVEDEAAIRNMLQRFLERTGYEVALARTAGEAHRLLQVESVDLVLTDISLPGSDGLQLIAELRALHGNVPIIAMSGAEFREELGVLDAAVQLGASQALKKPFGLDELLGAISSALGAKVVNGLSSSAGKAG
jgi:DNA-binding response OmpR family regulator